MLAYFQTLAEEQVADEQTTGGLYVTEAGAHGTAATFAGLEARYRRGRGVGDDPEEPRAPQGPPTLEDALASLGHVGVLPARWSSREEVRKGSQKSSANGPTLVVISALTQERAEALVNICHRSGKRKKLDAYMAALRKMVVSKLSKHRSIIKQNLKRVQNHAVENAIRAATAQRVR